MTVVTSGSIDMKVLKVLRTGLAYNMWLTPREISESVSGPILPNDSITSSIRRLRTQGFVINHTRRTGRIRQYSLRKDITSA